MDDSPEDLLRLEDLSSSDVEPTSFEFDYAETDVDLITPHDLETRMFLAKLHDLSRDVEELESIYVETPITPLHGVKSDAIEEEEEEEKEFSDIADAILERIDNDHDTEALLHRIDGLSTEESIVIFDDDFVFHKMSPKTDPGAFGDQTEYIYRDVRGSPATGDPHEVFHRFDPMNSIEIVLDPRPDPPPSGVHFSESQFRLKEPLLDPGPPPFDPEIKGLLGFDARVETIELGLFLRRSGH
jgi:hypothetical protein